jgi:thiamine-phosphate pyrophosphorylase
VTLHPFYAIVDYDLAHAHGWTVPALARACLDAGARLLQIRAKALGAAALLEVCEQVARDAAAYGATLIVNDRADIARLVPGAGVHVGQDDLPPALVRPVVGDDAIVGFSTHTREQIDRAVIEPIDYLAVGPVFGTRTKDTGYEAIGLDLVRYAADAAARAAARRGDRPLPVVAIGGITLETATLVLAAGAQSVAVISDLLVGAGPVARVRAFVECTARHPEPGPHRDGAGREQAGRR